MVAVARDIHLARDKVRSVSMANAIARDIGLQILSGQFKPGDLIGGEVDASKLLSVSRTTYREAMLILAAKGLVERRQRAGTRVTRNEHWNLLDPDVLAWTAECDSTEHSLGSLFELRRAIEPAAAALAAERSSASDIEEMKRAVELMSCNVGLLKHSRMPVRQFRSALLRASRNLYFGRVGQVIERMMASLERPSSEVGMSELQRCYGDVLNAVTSHDPARARQAMCDVIDRSWKHTSATRAQIRLDHVAAEAVKLRAAHVIHGADFQPHAIAEE